MHTTLPGGRNSVGPFPRQILASYPELIGFCCSFILTGLGMAVNLSLNNVFCANLVNSTTTLGAFHGSYGIGGTVGPLIATAMVTHGVVWSRFYLLTLCVTLVNLVFAWWAFRAYEQDAPAQLLSALERTASRRAAAEAGEPTKVQLFKQAVRNRTTIFGALFIFAYQGAEVSISGWVISFLINYRNGDPARVGYVTAGIYLPRPSVLSPPPSLSLTPSPPPQTNTYTPTQVSGPASLSAASS